MNASSSPSTRPGALAFLAFLAFLTSLLLTVRVVARSVDDGGALGALIRDALRANEGRYPHGTLRVKVTRNRELNSIPDRLIETRVQWDRELIRTSAEILETRIAANKRVPSVSRDTVDTIVGRTSVSSFSRSAGRVATWTPPKMPVPEGVLLRPEDLWYGKTEGKGLSWSAFLDPAYRSPIDPTAAVTFEVKRLDDDKVQVTRDIAGVARFRIVCSLAADGNVVEAEMLGDRPSLAQRHHRRYEWRRDDKKRLILKTYESIQVYSHEGKSSETKTTYEVLDFDPDSSPAPSEFGVTSLPVPPDAFAIDGDTGRRTRRGDAPVDDVVRHLDALSSELRSRGFAVERR